MTTAAPASPHPAASRTARSASRSSRRRIQGRQTILHAIRSEWIKICSLRSTWVTSFLTVAITVLFSAGATIGFGRIEGYEDMARYNITLGATFGQIVVAVLAALVITGEYSSGQIRSSLAAVPHRGRLLWAKALVTSVVAFLLGSLSIFLSWAISAPFLGEHAGSLTDSHYLGFIWGTGLAYAGIALMTLGLGFLLRSTAGSITVVTVLLFVINLPLQIMAQQWDWAAKIMGVLPSTVSTAVSDPFQLTPLGWGSSEAGQYFLEHSQAVLVFAAWAVVPLLIRREDHGPIIFRQTRVGLDGKEFRIWKFRTMRVNADAELAGLLSEQGRSGKPLFKIDDDPRITRIGHFLRRSSIDELPQLFNVIGGSMSLVGPRPQVPKEVALYDETAARRLLVKPGLTGLWQVNGRSSLTWEEALRFDLFYVENWTPVMDLAILLKTVGVVLRREGSA